MYSGFGPEQTLGMVLERQEEMRAQVQRDVRARRIYRPFREWSPAAFKLWRLRVVVWFDDAREA